MKIPGETKRLTHLAVAGSKVDPPSCRLLCPSLPCILYIPCLSRSYHKRDLFLRLCIDHLYPITTKTIKIGIKCAVKDTQTWWHDVVRDFSHAKALREGTIPKTATPEFGASCLLVPWSEQKRHHGPYWQLYWRSHHHIFMLIRSEYFSHRRFVLPLIVLPIQAA